MAKPMKEVSVCEILDQYNLIVPEIQREYVWGFNQYAVFETFLNDIKEGFEAEGDYPSEALPILQTLNNPAIDEATKKSLAGLLANFPKVKPAMNIGFLYSYRPSYYIGNDREEDIYLIDGQQRFTTLFLLLLYFSLKENRKKNFEQLFKFNASKEKIAFDYRVRSITHQFIIELVEKSNTVEDLLSVRQKRWFLAKYANDTTIKSIIGKDEKSGVFRLLHASFSEDQNPYYDFITSNIKFWHFKTEETSQGEELYITMNSRGQQLADNETIRARLFEDAETKGDSLYWSERWEQWQDFFWKCRNKNIEGISADEGFNEFLRWVQILAMWKQLFRNNKVSQDSIKVFEKVIQWESGSQLDVNYLSLPDIEVTFNAVYYLFKKFTVDQQQLKTLYSKSFNDKLFNPEWLSTDGDPLDLIAQFQLLPILQYCKNCLSEKGEVNNHTLYRLIRIVSTLSKDITIRKAVRNQVANILLFADSLLPDEDVTALLKKAEISKTILNNELSTKLSLVTKVKTEERTRLEDNIWFAEDIDINNGEIFHLIQLTNSVNNNEDQFNIPLFEKIVRAFKELIDNKSIVRGNILATDCYIDSFDRLEYHNEWFKKEGFLQLVKDRINKPSPRLADFLMEKQKEFVKIYQSVDALFAEANSGKQLFLYYIVSTNNILDEEIAWNWDHGFRFGKLNPSDDTRILFDTGYVFQHYNSSFRENESKNLRIHYVNEENILKQLLNWSLS